MAAKCSTLLVCIDPSIRILHRMEELFSEDVVQQWATSSHLLFECRSSAFPCALPRALPL